MNKRKIIVLGSSNTDMTVLTSRLPVPGETVLGGEFTMGPGGKGANQAVAAQRLGGDVSFICKVGHDIFGKNAVEHYRNEGLDISSIIFSERPSGVALITVDDKAENCIVVASGANEDFTVADVESQRETIENAGILLLQLEIPVDAVLRAAQIAHEAGVYVVLNPAPYIKLPDEIYNYLSLVIPNQVEAAAMTGVEVHDAASSEKAVGVLKTKGVSDVIITMGSEGSAVYTDGRCTMVPARKVKAVDTTAAGDTFCGAVCVALSEGKDLVEAARFATLASSYTVQKVGAQESIPFIDELVKDDSI